MFDDVVGFIKSKGFEVDLRARDLPEDVRGRIHYGHDEPAEVVKRYLASLEEKHPEASISIHNMWYYDPELQQVKQGNEV